MVSLAGLWLLMTTSTFAPVCARADAPNASRLVAQAMMRVRRAAGKPVGIVLLTFIQPKDAARNRVGDLRVEVGSGRASCETVPYGTWRAHTIFAFTATPQMLTCSSTAEV